MTRPDPNASIVPTNVTTDRALTDLVRRLHRSRVTTIGFPSATDVDYAPLAPLLTQVINNVGDPGIDALFPLHTKEFEREVITFFADLFHAPTDQRWGYVTTGGTEGNLVALHHARRRHPDGIVYHSSAAHYSIPKAIDLLRMPHTVVHAQPRGEIDYTDLAIKLHHNRRRPAIVVANIGTTWTEAIDDVAKITAAIHDTGINRSYIHSDAALAGIPLALLDQPPNFDLSHGADSISISGHKFLGTPNPCGVIITKHRHPGDTVAYIGSTDTTLTGSRSGHTPVLLWYALRRLGTTGLRDRADRARDLARHTVQELTSLSWPAWRHPHALTVMLQTPPLPLRERWHLASTDGTSHIICMPGTRQAQVDAFVADLRHVTARTAPLMYPASLMPDRPPRG